MNKELKELLKQTNLSLAYYKKKDPEAYEVSWKAYEAIKETADALEKKGCHFMFLVPPKAVRIQNLSEFEQERLNNWTFDFNNIGEADAEIIKKLYEGVSTEYILETYDGAKVIDKNGHKILTDFSNSVVNIVNGIRVTPNQPKEWKNRIHIYGACTVRGTGVEDAHTISSFLQKEINEAYPNLYQCVNHGIGCSSSIYDDIYQINNTTLYKGDVVVLCNVTYGFLEVFLKKGKVMVHDTSNCFDRPHSYGEWFTDEPTHTNKVGNKVIANYLMKLLCEKNWVNGSVAEEKKLVGCLDLDTEIDKNWIESEDFNQYKEYLKANKKNDLTTNGGIVMNCNPFTYGHRYLIETAAKAVDQLYIFVVEEDKSYFKFEDRIKLVKLGTADLKNVTVIKSGKFIISALTFPGYFYKEYDKTAIVDTSNDMDLFGKYIAPVLGITKRFAGEEPMDPITNQYNESMRERLPLHGIEFVEIKRKEDDVNVISASRVRAALKDKNWEKIKDLVPETTLQFLIENYSE